MGGAGGAAGCRGFALRGTRRSESELQAPTRHGPPRLCVAWNQKPQRSIYGPEGASSCVMKARFVTVNSCFVPVNNFFVTVNNCFVTVNIWTREFKLAGCRGFESCRTHSLCPSRWATFETADGRRAWPGPSSRLPEAAGPCIRGDGRRAWPGPSSRLPEAAGPCIRGDGRRAWSGPSSGGCLSGRADCGVAEP